MGYYVVEGCDGAGKDVQADLLHSYLTRLAQLAKPAFPLRINEPNSDSPTGKLLRQCLRTGEYPKAHAAMFLADRMALQYGTIIPALQEGQDVVCVRSLLSTLVYQQEQWDLQWLFNIHRMMPANIDFLFILDVDPIEGLARVGKRSTDLEVYERLDIQERTRKRYHDLASDSRMQAFLTPGTGRIVVINTTGKSIEEVHAQILDCVMGKGK